MKIAIITDTHYGARKGSKHLHDYFELFYKNIFFPTLEQQGIRTVVHMGDAFDSRKSIDYQSLEWSKRVVFDPLSNYDLHMIIGNHDCYYKNTISSVLRLFLFLGCSAAVQNERQPRNTATLRPENLMALDSERILREAVGAFG